MKASVVVSMIVRNEETVLRRCLDSIAPYVEAISIVDTGSTDSTVDIAESYAQHVSKFYDANAGGQTNGALLSFADARNRALSVAENHIDSSSPFTMWLDASDVVIGGDRLAAAIDHSKIPEIARAGGACHLCFDTEMLNHKERVVQRFTRERVFCRGKYEWRGRVHEVLHAKGGPAHEAFSPLVVIQRPFREGPRRDPDRNLRILRKLVEGGEEPTARNVFHLGREYADRGEYAAARKWLLLYTQISQFEDEKASALLLLSELAAARLDLDEALQHALHASIIKEQWREPLIAAGKILYLKASRGEEFRRNRERAMTILVRAIELPSPPPTKMISAPLPKVEAYRLLGCCHMDLGETNEARHCLEDALKIDPDDEACKNLLERVQGAKNATLESKP
jgi:tetratricopeptide (TPR) repeat protein